MSISISNGSGKLEVSKRGVARSVVCVCSLLTHCCVSSGRRVLKEREASAGPVNCQIHAGCEARDGGVGSVY
jgi:hypothetical protein